MCTSFIFNTALNLVVEWNVDDRWLVASIIQRRCSESNETMIRGSSERLSSMNFHFYRILVTETNVFIWVLVALVAHHNLINLLEDLRRFSGLRYTTTAIMTKLQTLSAVVIVVASPSKFNGNLCLVLTMKCVIESLFVFFVSGLGFKWFFFSNVYKASEVGTRLYVFQICVHQLKIRMKQNMVSVDFFFARFVIHDGDEKR